MNDVLAAAYSYIARGWAVIPLHNIVGVACSCGSADPVHVYKQGGKHPVFREWQRSGLTTEAAVEATWRERPGANIGIQTGAVSRFWVLDVDPDNGGHTALAGLVAAYGVLPETYTVTTGSGGMHYYWAIPEWEPHAYRGRLPTGLDVRGWGGQVVAPPSVSGKGAYAVGSDVPIVAAPEWLLDMIRPPRRELPEFEAEPTGGGWSLAPIGGPERERALLGRALPEDLGLIAAAPPGTRNPTAFAVACRFWEFINAGWIEHDAIWAQFAEAARVADIDGTFTEGEVAGIWASARRGVAGKAAVLNDTGYHGTVVPFEALGVTASGFSSPGTAAVATPAPVTGQTQDLMFVDPANVDETDDSPPEVATAVAVPADPQAALRERLVSEELGRQWVREEAKKRLRELSQPPFAIEILDRRAQLLVQRPKPLVAGWLGRGQAARIYGPPGAGKSFVAVELAACVSTGRSWHGARVACGEVIYFAVEDAAGVALRLQAWERHHETEHRVHLVSTPIRMDVETVTKILGAVRAYFGEQPLGLIVIDTQAMATVGMDENDATAMGLFVEAVKLLANQTEATVLTVHHSGVKGGRARGSTSVLGAMDVEMESSITGRTVTLTGTKQKNIAKPLPLLMNLTPVDMDEVDEFAQPVTSCVLVAAGDPGTPPVMVDPTGGMPAIQRRALAVAAVLIETNATGETYSRVRARAAQVTDFGRTPASVTAAFSRAWAYLVERGRIQKALGREAYYFDEIEGLSRLDHNPDKKVIGAPETYIPPAEV